MEPEARAIAYKAARRLIQTKAAGELVGVFLTDMTLQTLQPYTTDGAKLSAAVEDLANRATTQGGREPSPLDSIVGRAQTPATASAADSGYGLAGFHKHGASAVPRAEESVPKAHPLATSSRC